jgi:hypothetical protein
MNSKKVFFYENRMIVSSKLFIGFVLIAAIFSYGQMRNLTIMGVANTAPFSHWSFSSFLCNLNSLLMPMLLLLCSRIYDKKELRVRPLIYSSRISITKYYFIKGSAAFLGYVLTALIPLIVSFTFYSVVFNFYDYGCLTLPILLFLLPPAIFMLGLGMLLGHAGDRLIYLLIPMGFFLPMIKLNLPIWLELFCGYLIKNYPEQLMSITANGTPAFMLPQGFYTSRILIVLAGIMFFAVACTRKNYK